MPFDNTIYRTTPKVLAKGFEGLRQLSTELTNELPWNFAWSFEECLTITKGCGSRGCGLGLARVLWPNQIEQARVEYLCAAIDLREHEGALGDIFGYNSARYYSNGFSDVTPARLAREIDRFCDEHEGG